MQNNGVSSLAMMKQTFILTLISAITMLISFGKETVVAFFFGTTSSADAYTVAVEFPTTLFSIISVAISTVLIPMYLKVLEKEGNESASKYASNLISLVIIVGCAFLIVFELFSGLLVRIVAPGLERNTLTLAISLFRMLLPVTMLTLLVNINTGISNSNKCYFFPALTPNLLNIPIIIASIVLARKVGILAVIYGTIAGIILELIYSHYIAGRYYKYHPFFNIHDHNLLTTIRLAIPTLIGTCAEEVNKIVDRFFSSLLPTGSIASLNYGAKLSTGIYSLIIASIATVSYSEFAIAAAKNDKDGLVKAFELANRISLLILFPIVAGGIYLSTELVSVVFERGEFSGDDVTTIAPIFSAYLIGLIFSAIRVNCCKLCFSLGNTKIPTYTTLICVAINIPLNAFLSKKLGATGLALASTLAIVTATIAIYLLIIRMFSSLKHRDNATFIIKLSISTIFMIIVLSLLRSIWPVNVAKALFLAVSVVIGCITFFLFLVIMRIQEVYLIIDKIWGKKR